MKSFPLKDGETNGTNGKRKPKIISMRSKTCNSRLNKPRKQENSEIDLRPGSTK